MHAENLSAYSIRWMCHAINPEDFHIGCDNTPRLIKLAGVSDCRRARTSVTTISSKEPDHRLGLVQGIYRTTTWQVVGC